MLDSYMSAAAGEEADGAPSSSTDSSARMPTRIEDVDKFMQQLAAAASGGAPLPLDEPQSGAPKPD